MKATFHIHFDGRCREAFEYYKEVVGANIGTMLSFEQSPVAQDVPEEWQNKIVHANLTLCGIEIAGDDLMPNQYEPPRGFYILLGIDNEPQTASVFEGLSKNGEVILPLQKTFWSSNYGIVRDQFGVHWKINGTA